MVMLMMIMMTVMVVVIKVTMMIILRFKGECLTGPDDGYAKNGKSTNCWSGVGGEYTDYTYEFND